MLEIFLPDKSELNANPVGDPLSSVQDHSPSAGDDLNGCLSSFAGVFFA